MTSGDLADLDFCYLTTSGRITGRPHRIEIWFALHERNVYLLSGGGDHSDWVRNLMVSSDVVIELGDRKRTTTAHVIEDPEHDALARRLLLQKYRPRFGGDLDEWGSDRDADRDRVDSLRVGHGSATLTGGHYSSSNPIENICSRSCREYTWNAISVSVRSTPSIFAMLPGMT